MIGSLVTLQVTLMNDAGQWDMVVNLLEVTNHAIC
jgi:hypothetical protein